MFCPLANISIHDLNSMGEVMNKPTLIILILLISATAFAGHQDYDRDKAIVSSTALMSLHINSAPATAKTDTIYLMGGPDRGDGKFQDDLNASIPDWEGWTSIDLTTSDASRWHIDPFNSPTATNALWCGEIFVPCGGTDTAEGYGNGYQEFINWYGSVTDHFAVTNMTIDFELNYDNEPGYDYLYLLVSSASGWNTIATYNGTSAAPIHVSETFAVPAVDLVGPGANQVHLRFEANSDGAWSDEDCLWPTNGLAQIDDIVVSGDNGIVTTSDDFESDLSTSNWETSVPEGVGNFAGIWGNLQDLDPCVSNLTPQVAFIDDGVVVPCTGGSLGTTWTYGPGSYIVNLTGGCAGVSEHLHNQVWSPAVAWADEAGNPLNQTHLGARFNFGVYKHLPISNGMFYTWHVRSSNDGGVTWDGWQDRNFVFYGNAEYGRHNEIVSDLMLSNPTHVQMGLGAYELGWVWGFVGVDGTPAPYFDNVSFSVFELGGPVIVTREIEMAQDNFPTIGDIDYINLGNNSIRFDMAGDILGSGFESVLPGDSLVFDVSTNRPDAALTGKPRLYYTMKSNPLFDSYRSHSTSSWVEGDTVRNISGTILEDKWSFDLPDEDLFFPGDIIHYYVTATDNMNGDIKTTTLPADITGYGVFPGDPGYTPMLWSSSFTVHGLPTMFSANPGDQPEILLWNDFGNRGGENEWIFALSNLGYTQGVDYDIYYTNAPTSVVSNGLGSRATLAQIAGYDMMIYTLGDLSSGGITSFTAGNWAVDKSNDDDLLDAWLQTGKDFLATGDSVVQDLVINGGVDGSNFVTTWFSVQYVDFSITQEIGGIVSPRVVPVPGNSVSLNTEFIANGGCPSFNYFDVVEPIGSAERIATWEDQAGIPYAAGVLNQVGASRIIYFPTDLMTWYTPQGSASPSGLPFAARTDALDEVLRYFGRIAPGSGTSVDDMPRVLTSRVWPNPFNPKTTLEYGVPRAGRVVIKLFDVRGQLIRTLVDAHVDAGVYQQEWNGKDDSGATVASGVYFAETRSGGVSKVEKLALVR